MDLFQLISQTANSQILSQTNPSRITAGYHIGLKASDPDAALEKIFTHPECQQDGLATILQYCQVKSGYNPGNTDASGMIRIIDSEFGGVLTTNFQPTTFMDYMGKDNSNMRTTDEMIHHMPNGSRLVQWIDSIPNYGNFDRSIIHMFTEVDGDFLSFYTISMSRARDGGSSRSESNFTFHSVDRDEMANRASWLVEKLGVKQSIDDWANGISSHGHRY